MASIIKKLTEQQHIRPPSWLPDNVRYECLTGSISYGVSSDDSDWDISGFCIPPKDIIFPHLAGIIQGFGKQQKRFVCYEQHHVKTDKKLYDIVSYNIVHYFHLCMENNPNMIDSLFVPRDCILHSSTIAEMVREKRKIFLHKGAWPRFKGYSFAQLKRMQNKNPIGKRAETVAQFGFDLKFAYHLVRLLDEIEQILTYGDLDLRKNREHLKAIRRGDVSEKDIIQWAADKEIVLEKLYESSKLQHSPDQEAIKNLLLCCLEEHFGNLDGCVISKQRHATVLREIANIIDQNKTIIWNS